MPLTSHKPLQAQSTQARLIFDKTLALIKELGILTASKRVFLVYAHDKPDSVAKANATVAKQLIEWLDFLKTPIYTDKTPLTNRGFFNHTASTIGSTEDILKSQVCLLPKHSKVPCEKVDRIILCGSEQLKAYETSEYYQNTYRPTLQRLFDTSDTNDLIPQLSTYINSQRKVDGFHHVLTELAFLEQRMVDEDHGVIPFVLNGPAESALPEWSTKVTTIHIKATDVDPRDESVDEHQELHSAFFKLFQRFWQDEAAGIRIIQKELYDHFLNRLQTENVTDMQIEIVMTKVSERLRREKTLAWQSASTQEIVKKSIQEAFAQQTTQSHLTTQRELQQWYANTLKSRLVIQRVSGDELPMESCYINLAIIESQPQKSKKDEYKAFKASFSRLGSVKHIANTHLDDPIALADLFKPRRLKSGIEGTPKRILVKGRTGVGKTTLAKKSVYDYLHHGLWKEHFDWVLWIPLHRLKGKHESYALQTFLYEEYFQEHPNGKTLAAALYQSMQRKPARTLLILDGWDEIAKERRADCVRTLLNHPSMLITTRPSGMASNEIASLDLELEMVGFSADNVKEYLNHPTIVEQTVSQAIQAFIEQNAFVQELVNIPIQLDALCFSWDEINSDDPTPTMTGLYEAMTRKLWRKDILNLGRHTALGMTEPQVTLMRQFSKLEVEIQSEQQCLGILALNGLYANQIEFTPSDLKTAVEQVETRRTDLYDAMDHLSCLQVERAAGSRTRLRYQFLHLTFQEYFAAQRLVHHLKTNTPLQFPQKEIPVKDFIHEAQYNPRYEIVWRFVAGLLDAKGLTVFFDLLEAGPIDLIGLQHQELLMQCLRESHDRLSPDRKKRIESTLYDWLVFEVNQIANCGYDISRLGRQPAFPEGLLLRLLKDELTLYTVARILVYTLGARPTLFDETIKALLLLVKNVVMRETAAWALGRVASASPEALNALLALAKDADVKVRRIAAEALYRVTSASPKVVEALLALAKDEDKWVRRIAADALGRVASASPKVVQALLVLAKDKDAKVRRIAVEALGNVASASSEVVQALIGLTKDAYKRVQEAAIEALGNVASASPQAVQALLLLAKDDADVWVSSTAALALGNIASASPEVVQALLGLTKDADRVVRRSAVDALGNVASASPQAMQALLVLAKDKDEWVRERAAKALDQVASASPQAVEALLMLAKDKDECVRSTAAHALGNVASASPQAVQALLLLAKDKDEWVRSAAAKALDQVVSASPQAVEALLVLAKDKDDWVRSTAADALGNVASASPEAVQALLLLANDADKWVRESAAEALGNVASASPQAVQALLLLANDADKRVRSAAAKALGQVASGSPEAVQALLRFTKDADAIVRGTAAEALGRVASGSPEVVQALLRFTKDAHAEVRGAAFRALGQVASGSPEAVQALLVLAKDKDEQVRKSAAKALCNQSLWNIYPLLPTAAESFLADLYKHCLIPSNFQQMVPFYLHTKQIYFYTPEGLQSIPLNEKVAEFSKAILKVQQTAGIPRASQIEEITLDSPTHPDNLKLRL